jgi:hypothetical protein
MIQLVFIRTAHWDFDNRVEALGSIVANLHFVPRLQAFSGVIGIVFCVSFAPMLRKSARKGTRFWSPDFAAQRLGCTPQLTRLAI